MSIGSKAFYNCSSLKSVVLLSIDITIEESVFYNLILEEVYFYGNATDWDNLNIETFGTMLIIFLRNANYLRMILKKATCFFGSLFVYSKLGTYLSN
ncbi:MAG: leucine-rich repeat domain-containing protein [Anaeroplasmataceae bacterium]|nr:leucine-rich repeat domain-containing protein [Anaeroplasmataceae bacterium]